MKEEARKTMRVAVYCRLARADQEDTLLEVQKERLRVYAKERGYDVVAEIAEIVSGVAVGISMNLGFISLPSSNHF